MQGLLLLRRPLQVLLECTNALRIVRQLDFLTPNEPFEAGHLLLVTFAVLSATLWDSTYVGAVAPAAMLILMTGFEILVSFLQAFIFTILTAVYMGGAIHPEH